MNFCKICMIVFLMGVASFVSAQSKSLNSKNTPPQLTTKGIVKGEQTLPTKQSFFDELKVMKIIELPKPKTQGGLPLMEALKNRKTVRSFSDKELDEQLLSNLLWAAFGINREDGKRTAPSAMNRQEIDIYIVTPSGYYFWEPEKNALLMLGDDDIRKFTGKQEFVPQAGLNLVMVYNQHKVKEATERQRNFAYCDAGYISQNIYLFCASEQLNTVARGGGFDEALPKLLQLDDAQEIILLQTIGFPPEVEKNTLQPVQRKN